MSEIEQTVSALNEAVRGKEGLQVTVQALRTEVRELQAFRSILIGIQLAIGFISPILMHYLLGIKL